MKKGFTLVELLAVIAIIAVLSIIALPSVVEMFNESKKNTFLNEARTAYKVAKQTWILNPMRLYQDIIYCKGSSCDGEKLDLSGRDNFEYNIKFDTEGHVVKFYATDGTFELYYEGNVLLSDIAAAREIGDTPYNNNSSTPQGYFNDRFCFFIPNYDFTSYTKEYVPMHAGSTWEEFFNYVTTNTVDGFTYKLHSVFDSSFKEYRPGDPNFETVLNEPKSYVYYTLEYNDIFISYRGKYNNSTHVEWETIDAFGTSLTDWQSIKIADHLDDVIKNDTLGCYGQGWG